MTDLISDLTCSASAADTDIAAVSLMLLSLPIATETHKRNCENGDRGEGRGEALCGDRVMTHDRALGQCQEETVSNLVPRPATSDWKCVRSCFFYLYLSLFLLLFFLYLPFVPFFFFT